MPKEATQTPNDSRHPAVLRKGEDAGASTQRDKDNELVDHPLYHFVYTTPGVTYPAAFKNQF